MVDGKQCFMCNSSTSAELGVNLQSSDTKHTKTNLAVKLFQLIGKEFFVIVSEEDLLCASCLSVINHVDKLESELDIARRLITDQLKFKYDISEGDCADAHNIHLSDLSKDSINEEIIKNNNEFIVCKKLQQSTLEGNLKKHATGVQNSNTSSNLEKFQQSAKSEECLLASESKWECNACHLHLTNISDYRSHIKSHHLLNSSEPESKTIDTEQSLISLDDRVERFQLSDLHRFEDCKDGIFKSCNDPTDSCSDKLINYHQCEICSVVYLDKESLLAHLKSGCVDLDQNNINNDQIISIDSNNLQNIETVSILDKSETYQCVRCSLQFNGANSFLGHVCFSLKRSDEQELEMYFANIHQLSDLTKEDCKLDVINEIIYQQAKYNVNVDDLASLNEDEIVGEDQNLDSKMHFSVVRTTQSIKTDLVNNAPLSNLISKTENVDDKVFTNRASLVTLNSNALLPNSPERSSYLCECLYVTDSSVEFKEHSMQCDRFFCSACELYVQKACKIDHMKQQHQVYLCGVCSFEAAKKFQLRKHKLLCHPQVTGELRCQFCGEKFKNKRKMQTHENGHPESFKFKCGECGEEFRHELKLKKHKEKHRELVCVTCGKAKSNLKLLKTHERIHLKEDLVCAVCSRVFKTKYGFSNHMAQHAGQFKFFCDICQQGFMVKLRFEEHKCKHTKENRYVCDICGQSFQFQSSMWIHRKWHSNPFPYKCNQCGRLFKHTSLLAVHKRKHTGDRPHKCQQCEASFTVASTLKRHMLLHTNKSPYECELCLSPPLTFSRRDKLNEHLAKVHYQGMSVEKSPSKMVVDEDEGEKEVDQKLEMHLTKVTAEEKKEEEGLNDDLFAEAMNVEDLLISTPSGEHQVFEEIILDLPLQPIALAVERGNILPDMCP